MTNTLNRKTCINCNCLINKIGQYPQLEAMFDFAPEGYQRMIIERYFNKHCSPEQKKIYYEQIHEALELGLI